MEIKYDQRVKSEGFNEDDRFWINNPIQRKGRFPRLQSSWEGDHMESKMVCTASKKYLNQDESRRSSGSSPKDGN